MSLTSDPSDPRLGHGTDREPRPQNEAYLVLSEEERAKGFVRPVRLSYRHAGIPGPRWPLRDLTSEEQERYAGNGYVKYEEYPPDDRPVLGRFWTQAHLDGIGKGCGAVTTMNRAIAETYSRSPGFYGATYCCKCMLHLPVGPQGEFTWIETDGSEAGKPCWHLSVVGPLLPRCAAAPAAATPSQDTGSTPARTRAAVTFPDAGARVSCGRGGGGCPRCWVFEEPWRREDSSPAQRFASPGRAPPPGRLGGLTRPGEASGWRDMGRALRGSVQRDAGPVVTGPGTGSVAPW